MARSYRRTARPHAVRHRLSLSHRWALETWQSTTHRRCADQWPSLDQHLRLLTRQRKRRPGSRQMVASCQARQWCSQTGLSHGRHIRSHRHLGRPGAHPRALRDIALPLCALSRGANSASVRTTKSKSRAIREGGGGRGGDIWSLCASFWLTNCELAVLDRLPGASGEI